MNRLLCAAALSATLASLLSGCFGTYGAISPAFDHRFADNDARQTRALLQRLPAAQEAESPSNALHRPVAVATVHGESPALVAFDLSDGARLWSQPIEAMTRPEVCSDVVLTSTRTQLRAFDLGTGEALWEQDLVSGLAYLGGDRAGSTIVFVQSVGASGGATRVGRVQALDARTGQPLWEHEIVGVLGRPAAMGGYAFVPWERQNIAILDLATGVEITRLRSTDDVIAWVHAHPSGVHYGSQGIYRLTGRSHAGTRDGSTYLPAPIPDAPRSPLVQDDAFFPMPGTRSARGRIRIYFSPTVSRDEARVAILADTFYLVYYRYVFAFDAESELRWVRILEQDVIGAEVVEAGLFTIGEQGRAELLSHASGGTIHTLEVGTEIASVALDAAGFRPAPSASAGDPEAGAAPEQAPEQPAEQAPEQASDRADAEAGADPAPSNLRFGLIELAGDPDNRLVPARAFAIQLLARMPEPEITQDLLDLYSQRSMPGALREAIATALRTRGSGSEFLVSSLARRYDFLQGTQNPPLTVIVPSLLESADRRSVPGLIERMMDHETPLAVLPLVVRGVVELGDAAVVPALRFFLTLYHADSTFSENQEALAVAAEGIFRHGGEEGREMLQSLVADASTHADLSTAISGIFEAEQRQAESRARADADAAARAAEEAARAEREGRPIRLSQRQINEVFANHTEALRRCTLEEVQRNPQLGQVRIVFILESEGLPTQLAFSPNTPEFVACLEPQVQAM
ncbi:MAG: PQQ-binding-like beta-propeller repeat protein, partial [Myxococcales bacterium]|nr:PQQ-binding-like beta-propeller repeat protein [Myxococcales bacterium]